MKKETINNLHQLNLTWSEAAMLQFTTVALEPEQALEAAIPQQPTLTSTDNVVVTNFGQPRRS